MFNRYISPESRLSLDFAYQLADIDDPDLFFFLIGVGQ